VVHRPVHPYADVGDRIAALRRALARTRGRRLTQRDVAAELGVHAATVTAWEIGRQRPEGENLRRLAVLLGVAPEEIAGPSALPADAAAPRALDGPAAELFASFDGLVRYLGGIAAPGQSRLRKLDALEGLRRLLAARGALPDWWFELRERVESGDL
jgi:transcriptional regulator with XRE-family HTH domain